MIYVNIYSFARQSVGFLMLIVLSLSLKAQKLPIDYVNNFIGTGSDGNTYPGAQAPFGMISISPSNTFPDYNSPYARGSYNYERKEIRGFGLTHYSGVGCQAMQDLLFMPIPGDLDLSPVNNRDAYKSTFSHDDEKASPGWYQVQLKDYNINTRFTTTQRSGIGEIDYTSNKKANLVFEPTNSANGISTGQLKINAKQNRISGYVTTGGFCWHDPSFLPYTIYFVAEFDTPLSGYGIWKGQDKKPGADTVSGNDIAAYFTFDNPSKPVHIKTAISFVSVENALLNLQREIPDWNMEKVYQQTRMEWNKYLNKIEVNGCTDDQKATFYTAIYHNLLQPNIFDDVNGEYIGFDFKTHKIEAGRHKYVNFSLWDTYRTTAALQAIIAPEEASDMAQSLLLDAQQGGAFPNWSMNNIEYGVMNGYSPFPFIASLYAFGATNFDLRAVKDMMEKVSMNYYGCQGRAGWLDIEEYKKIGYVPFEMNTRHAVSMTEEYGIDDYAIAKICKAAGDTQGEEYHLKRSQNVFNLYNPETGFFQARNATGKFISGWRDTTTRGFNEGNAIQYLWMVPYSISKLITKLGGKEVAEKRLDHFVSKIVTSWTNDKPYYYIGNEPSFGTMYIYNYLQVPWKAQYNVRRLVNEYYNNTFRGLPGDDDVGTMSALYVFSSIGLYPYIPGEGRFTLSGPLFKQVTIRLKNNKNIIINAPEASSNSPYIKSLSINGKPSSKLWINWSEINKGSILNFEMSEKANKTWGSAISDIPPTYLGHTNKIISGYQTSVSY